MKKYITKSTKSESVQKIINEALEILESVGIPIVSKTERSLEKMAVCFLAVASVTQDSEKASDKTHLKTREIIKIVNNNFEENISPGSYDDIRRKDLKLLVIADLIINSGDKPGAATNDPTRGYGLHPDFKNLIISYGTASWNKRLKAFNKSKPSLTEILAIK